MALRIDKTFRLDLSGLSLSHGAQLHTHAVVRAVGSGLRTRERNVIHYDTADLALYRDGVILTLDKQGEQWLQRCTLLDDHGHRIKWLETPVATHRLNLDALREHKKLFSADTFARLQRQSIDLLAPVFTVHCHDKQWSLFFPENVSMTVREEWGYLKFGVTRQPFHELVLEHQSGHQARWFQTVLELAFHFSPDDHHPLSLGCMSPVARGFAWLDPSLVVLAGLSSAANIDAVPYAENNPFMAVPFELRANMTIQQAFGHLSTRLLQRVQACRRVVLFGGKNAKLDAVRWLAQTVRQLETLITLCRALFPKEVYGELDTEVRWLLKELDRVLAWQMFVRETLEPLIEQFHAHSGLEIPLSKAREGQQLAIKRLGTVLRSFRYTRLVVGLANWIEGGGWEFLSDPEQRAGMGTPVGRFAAEMLCQYQEPLRASGCAFADLDLAGRCGLRRHVDAMMHTTHLFSELFPNKRTVPFRTRLHGLYTSIHKLVDLYASNRFFARLIDKRQETVGHLIQDWQSARTNRRLIDSNSAWEHYSSGPTFW